MSGIDRDRLKKAIARLKEEGEADAAAAAARQTAGSTAPTPPPIEDPLYRETAPDAPGIPPLPDPNKSSESTLPTVPLVSPKAAGAEGSGPTVPSAPSALRGWFEAPKEQGKEPVPARAEVPLLPPQPLPSPAAAAVPESPAVEPEAIEPEAPAEPTPLPLPSLPGPSSLAEWAAAHAAALRAEAEGTPVSHGDFDLPDPSAAPSPAPSVPDTPASPFVLPGLPVMAPDEDAVDIWALLAFQLRTDTPRAPFDGSVFMTGLRRDQAYQAGTMVEGEVEGGQKIETPGLGSLVRGMEWGQVFRNIEFGDFKPFLGFGLLVGIIVLALRSTFWGGVYYVYLSARVPDATTVSVVGDFNQWAPAATPLRRQGMGSPVWEGWVKVTPGRYRYRFLVDGKTTYVDGERPGLFEGETGQGASVLFVPSDGTPPTTASVSSPTSPALKPASGGATP